ncbi:nucleotide exchange factor GrpE [Archangium gephyra]|uniref:nucleotide exchange factor GrpE n=1 Tax=Archangium gephyra TaxID=48 RepID=UPI003B762C8C
MNGNPRTEGASQDAQAQEAAASAAPETSTEQQPPAQEAAPAVDAEKQRLEAELATARRRVDQLARAYQELEKDREEFKQRLTRERERMMDVERGNVATVLLEAVDELDRSLAMSGGDVSSPLAQGVKMIRDGMLSKLQQSGIERLQVVGLPYDPNTAEATDMEMTANPDDDQKVVAEVRAGYRLKERIIRPARVKVAKYIAPAQA